MYMVLVDKYLCVSYASNCEGLPPWEPGVFRYVGTEIITTPTTTTTTPTTTTTTTTTNNNNSLIIINSPRDFMICTPHQILFGWSNQKEWDGQCMWHVWETGEMRNFIIFLHWIQAPKSRPAYSSVALWYMQCFLPARVLFLRSREVSHPPQYFCSHLLHYCWKYMCILRFFRIIN